MRRLIRVVAIAALWINGATPVLAQQTGRVERVIDGDTIVVTGIGTVRLIGVDTPETLDPRKTVQYFGQEASRFTKALADQRLVRLEYEGQHTDAYGRTLAYVFLPDGRLLNEEIIRQGFGHAYTKFPFARMAQFRTVEADAMREGRGLWGAAPTPTAGRASAATSTTPTAASDVTVYVTRTGTKYHRAGCRYLARSQIPMKLSDAAGRYSPCSVCHPPTLAAAASPATVAAAPVRAPRASPTRTSGRCQAITKKGTQCKRIARPGSAYCWQHGG